MPAPAHQTDAQMLRLEQSEEQIVRVARKVESNSGDDSSATNFSPYLLCLALLSGVVMVNRQLVRMTR